MRVKGDVSPEIVHVEEYYPLPGFVELRVRENITEITEEDRETGEERTLFEYDEYLFHLPGRENLKEEVEGNLENWIITGRTMEVNMAASILQDMQTALEILGVNK